MREQKKKEQDGREEKGDTPRGTCPGTGYKKRRKQLPKEIIYKIQRRDHGRCTYVSPDGKRCGQKRWLHYHHVLGVARGGKDVLDNLTTLCSAHHHLVHEDQRA